MNWIAFIHKLQWKDIPDDARHQAKRCLLDAVGSAIAGRQTELSRIIHDFVVSMYGGKGCHLWLDGREVSPAGAVLAQGMTIDSLDIHDNCNAVKGHAGVAIIPTALAMLERKQGESISGRELLTSIVVGYEIAIRAGLALHSTACDYHSSGAWNALGCAAVASRWLHLNREKTRHALGIAEYHGPRSQMMRCIDHPTMLKDGSGWGAMAGVSAAWMARAGFTGAPALTVESPEVESIWADIGSQWHICQQDFKRYAVCHWAQPAIAGTLKLLREHQLSPEQIRRIRVFTFHEATRLQNRRPQNTEQAQYCLPFPVASAIFHDHLGINELRGASLTDPRVLNLVDRVELLEDKVCNEKFPETQTARVQIELIGGSILDSGVVLAPWDMLGVPAKDEELLDKFRGLVGSMISETRARKLEKLLWQCGNLADASHILPLLPPPGKSDA